VKQVLSPQLAVVALIAASAVPLASGSATGTFPLHIPILWSGDDAACVGSYPPTVECRSNTGAAVAVPGVGFVSESYLYPIDTAPGPVCPPSFFKILSYPAHLVVKGRGEIFLDVSAADGCVEGFSTAMISPTQRFSVTGGSGVFAGASGSGVVMRTLTQFTSGTSRSSGVDTWAGTLVVPNWDADVTPPTITGAVNKVVRAARKARTMRVRYRVTAKDNVDAAVPVVCVPPSGSRFKVGARTPVHCSATDTSANTANASFVVTVRRSSKR
jgi:hypothetical protein